MPGPFLKIAHRQPGSNSQITIFDVCVALSSLHWIRKRLDKTDADYVEHIHTASGPLPALFRDQRTSRKSGNNQFIPEKVNDRCICWCWLLYQRWAKSAWMSTLGFKSQLFFERFSVSKIYFTGQKSKIGVVNWKSFFGIDECRLWTRSSKWYLDE